MKKVFLLMTAALSASLLFISCKKESINNPGSGSNPPATTKLASETTSVGVFTYKYDESGRLIVVKKNGSSNQHTTATYTYTLGKIVKQEWDNGSSTYQYTYDLNSEGLVVKETLESDPDYLETTIYNSDKRVVKRIATNNGNIDVADYFYSNGNCDSTRFSSNGTWNSTVKKTFYTDKANTLDYNVLGKSHFGSKSKNLQHTEQYFFADGSHGDVLALSYEFDAFGRVSKSTETHGNNIDIRYFTYQ